MHPRPRGKTLSENKPPSFWTTLPGVLTGAAGLVTALTGLYVAVVGESSAPVQPDPERRDQVQPAPEPSPPAPTPQPAVASPFRLPAVIDDPDGYTNVRSRASADAQIVARVQAGERFLTYRQDGNWWQVKTQDGKVGYMHVSRIRLQTP